MRDLFDFEILDFGEYPKRNQIGIISSGNYYCVLNKRKINVNDDNYTMIRYHA